MKNCFLLILVISLLFYSCKKENEAEKINLNSKIYEHNDIDKKPIVDPFSLNLFENVGDTVDYYKNKEGYKIVDNTPPKNYREKEDPDNEMIAGNTKINVYFRRYREIIFREVEILEVTDESVLGKYIGLSKDQIIEIFGEETTWWPGNLGRLQYVNKNQSHVLYIDFYFASDDGNKIITRISYGDMI
jgi:hypothetical protein